MDDHGLHMLHLATTLTSNISAATIACCFAACDGRAKIMGGSGKGRYRYQCNKCNNMWSQERDTRNGAYVRIAKRVGVKRGNYRVVNKTVAAKTTQMEALAERAATMKTKIEQREKFAEAARAVAVAMNTIAAAWDSTA